MEQVIREFIVSNFLLGGGAPPADHASLLDEGIIDSTGVLELVEFLERRFGVRVEDREMVPENLDGITRIAAFVTRKRERSA